MQGWHEYNFVFQLAAAEIIEVIETAAQLKKGSAGVKQGLGSQHAHRAYDSRADDLNLPEKEGQAGLYFIFSRFGLGTWKTFYQGCNIDLISG